MSDEMTAEEMEHYNMRKCLRCGQVKCVVDFPVELEPIVPGISQYCVECATKKLKEER